MTARKMDKVSLLFVLVLGFSFTLVACQDGVDVQQDVSQAPVTDFSIYASDDDSQEGQFVPVTFPTDNSTFNNTDNSTDSSFGDSSNTTTPSLNTTIEDFNMTTALSNISTFDNITTFDNNTVTDSSDNSTTPTSNTSQGNGSTTVTTAAPDNTTMGSADNGTTTSPHGGNSTATHVVASIGCVLAAIFSIVF